MRDYLCLTRAEYVQWVALHALGVSVAVIRRSWDLLPYPFIFDAGEPLVVIPVQTPQAVHYGTGSNYDGYGGGRGPCWRPSYTWG